MKGGILEEEPASATACVVKKLDNGQSPRKANLSLIPLSESYRAEQNSCGYETSQLQWGTEDCKASECLSQKY
jgi:hypothetical protein